MAVFDYNLTSLTEPIVSGVNYILPRIPVVLFSVAVGGLVIRMLIRLLRVILKLTTLPLGLRGIITSVSEILLWTLLSITAMKQLGFSDIVTFFSSSTLAIGIMLAAGGSTLLSDIVAGIFLARDSDFDVGDEVIAGENRTQGIIESIDARRTRIRDKNGILHIIPNSVIERKEWELIRNNDAPTGFVRAVKTARRLSEATRERAAIAKQKRTKSRENDQETTLPSSDAESILEE